MKRIAMLTILLAVLLAPAAQAQAFGQLGPLTPRASSGIEEFGAYLGFATGTSIAATGQVRLGMGKKMDLGIQGGFAKGSNSGPTSMGGQVDLRMALMDLGGKDFKLGGDLAAQVSHTGSTSVSLYGTSYDTPAITTIGVDAIPGVSITTQVSPGKNLSGWGGFGVSMVHFSGGGQSGTNTNAMLRLGGSFDVTNNLAVVAEFNDRFVSGGSASAFMVGVSLFQGTRVKVSSKPATAPAKKAKGK
jgi:hypothetical protein